MWERWLQICGSRATLFVAPILAMAGLLSLAMGLHGRPLDLFTWAMLVIALVCSAFPGLFRLRWLTAVLFLLPGVYIAFPGPFLAIPVLERWSLCDDRGG